MDIVLDVSRYQGAIDWHKAASRLRELGVTVPRVAIRATVGDYYMDDRLLANWDGARAAGFRTTAYHVVTPDISAAAQADWFLGATAGLVGAPDLDQSFDWVLDCEIARGQGKHTVTQVIKDMLALIGGNAAIYTRKSWWDANVETGQPDWYASRPLWVAHYGVDTPALPVGWSDWTLWQYSADGNHRGAEYGAQSDSIDLSYMRVSTDPPVPEPYLELHVAVPSLNVRGQPSVIAPVIGRLHHGDTVAVEEIYTIPGAAGEIWIRHAGGWSALAYRGYVYMVP